MKTRMVNRIVNKYLLHNRSIQFKSKDEFESFMERRKDINRAKHKQPPTLNVKANLDKLSLGDMQVFRFNFRHETKKKNFVYSWWIQHITTFSIPLEINGQTCT